MAVARKRKPKPPRAEMLSEQLVTRLKASTLVELDDYAQEHGLDRSKAARELIETALRARR
jgi:hypothetical protein